MENSARQNFCRSPGQSQRLPGGTFAHLPNKTVVIEMEQGRSGDDAGEDAFDCVDLELGVKIGKRAVGKNQTEIKTNKRAAASKHKTHKSADAFVFLDPVAIINPNQREVLHIVENLKQGDANEQIGNSIIAIPPKGDARNEQGQFYWISSLPMSPTPNKVTDKNRCNPNGEKKQAELCDLQRPRFNEGAATGVKHA